MHGGKIWAENRSSGQGACFIFTLPENPEKNRGI